jgi:hypothetical protein
VLLGAGGVLAVVQPGDLGDSDSVASSAPTTESTAAAESTTTTVVVTTTTAVTDASPADSATPTTITRGETAPTVAGSGIAGGGTPTGGTDGIAETGRESMLGAGLALGALGLALRRLRPAPR